MHCKRRRVKSLGKQGARIFSLFLVGGTLLFVFRLTQPNLHQAPLQPVLLRLNDSALKIRTPARERHPCGKQFLATCQKTGNSTLNKSRLQLKWRKPLTIKGLRRAIGEHNERQKKACQGQVTNPRLLVFTCSNSPDRRAGLGCHALADGVRGIALAFILAVLEKRSFFMHTVNWLPFEDYFPPKMTFRLTDCPALAPPNGSVLWSVTQDAVVYNLLQEPPSSSCEKIRNFGLLGSPRRILSMNSNQVSECMYRLLKEAGYSVDYVTEESVTRLVLETLFHIPGKKLEDILTSFLKAQRVDLERSVCLHVRSGIRYNHGVDDGCLFKNIDDIWRCARAMEITSERLSTVEEITWVMIGDNDLHKQIALDYIVNCSDPLFTRNRLKRRIVDTNSVGHIAHSAAGKRIQKDDQLRVFFDFVLLSRCRHLVVTPSGYSQLAALLHPNCSERQHMFVQRRDTPTNNLNVFCVPVQQRC